MAFLIRSKKNVLILFLFYSILMLLLPPTQAFDLYADLEITVDNAGFVNIEGNTNYPDLIVENSEKYTSKTQSLWTLNITKNVTFSDFIFSIILPEHTEIRSISSSGSTLISEESGNLVIKGYGSNKSLSILIEYQTNKILETVGTFGLDLFSLVLIVTIFVLIICFLFILLIGDKREKPMFSQKRNNAPLHEHKGLNDRQKKIMKLLQESKIALTQTDIQRELQMPKASISRNIRSLELKGLIEKEQIGMSNLIRLKKP